MRYLLCKANQWTTQEAMHAIAQFNDNNLSVSEYTISISTRSTKNNKLMLFSLSVLDFKLNVIWG